MERPEEIGRNVVATDVSAMRVISALENGEVAAEGRNARGERRRMAAARRAPGGSGREVRSAS